MRDKIASLVDQIRKCAADLEYLADEEEKGFTAGLEEEEIKVSKRVERIASELEKLELQKKADWEEAEMIDNIEDEMVDDIEDKHKDEKLVDKKEALKKPEEKMADKKEDMKKPEVEKKATEVKVEEKPVEKKAAEIKVEEKPVEKKAAEIKVEEKPVEKKAVEVKTVEKSVEKKAAVEKPVEKKVVSKVASMKKVACTCARCGNREIIGMTLPELQTLHKDIIANSGDIFGPKCDKCPGELIPDKFVQ